PELIVLEANRHHPSVPPIARVEVHCFPPHRGGKDALIESLNAKQLDLTVDLARADVDQVHGMRKVFRPGASTCVLAFNTQGRMADANHRRAIAKVLDLHALSEANYQNSVAYLARGVLPPMLGRPRASNVYSPLEGAQELSNANFEEPLRLLRVWAPRSYNPEPAGTATLIAQQLVAAGVPVSHIAPKTPQDYQACLDAADYDLVLGGWIADTASPLDFYEALFSRASIPSASNNNPNSCNMARWDDPKTNELLAALRRDGDTVHHQKIEDHISAERPVLPLMYGPSIALHGWHVQGFAWGQQPYPSFTELELAR
ncbi:MAG: ABC transporter substrate-binding protein, partial [Nannocystaceae bacterium]